jgi:recombinational DNA repair protein RecT
MKQQMAQAMQDPAVAERMRQMQEMMSKPEMQQQMAEMQAYMQNQQLQQRMQELRNDPGGGTACGGWNVTRWVMMTVCSCISYQQ